MRDATIIAMLVVLIIASAGAGYYVGNSSRQTTTITVTSAPIQTTPFSRSNGEWVFSIRFPNFLLAKGNNFQEFLLPYNLTNIPSGYNIALSYNLTNISGQPQSVHVAYPLINPTIYSANGTVVWASNPPEFNGITTIPYGAGNWSVLFLIPTYALLAGQKYVLSVYPLIGATTTSAMAVGDYSTGESLMINTTIGIS
jgi:hypothetical protein